MKTNPPILIAITGGSGSGKSWLALRLQKLFSAEALIVRQDNFYRNRSHMPAWRREKLNFDHPRALDWPLFEKALRLCHANRPFPLPLYDFATHTRFNSGQICTPNSLVLVEGLWLLRPRALQTLFDFSIYLDCPSRVRLERRLQRDVVERQRSVCSIKEQFRQMVAPMHSRFIAPQAGRADLVLPYPAGERHIKELANIISELLRGSTIEQLKRQSLLLTSISTNPFQP